MTYYVPFSTKLALVDLLRLRNLWDSKLLRMLFLFAAVTQPLVYYAVINSLEQITLAFICGYLVDFLQLAAIVRITLI